MEKRLIETERHVAGKNPGRGILFVTDVMPIPLVPLPMGRGS